MGFLGSTEPSFGSMLVTCPDYYFGGVPGVSRLLHMFMDSPNGRRLLPGWMKRLGGVRSRFPALFDLTSQRPFVANISSAWYAVSAKAPAHDKLPDTDSLRCNVSIIRSAVGRTGHHQALSIESMGSTRCQ